MILRVSAPEQPSVAPSPPSGIIPKLQAGYLSRWSVSSSTGNKSFGVLVFDFCGLHNREVRFTTLQYIINFYTEDVVVDRVHYL